MIKYHHMDSTVLFLFICVIILFCITIALTWLYVRQQRFFSAFTRNITSKDLKTLLQHLAESLEAIDQKTAQNEADIAKFSQESQSHFQKIGFIRFNPFSDTGGDQSFCLCLLDAHHNGVVITSLHNREQTRIYAKTVHQGKSDQQTFFEEEKQALKQALSNPKPLSPHPSTKPESR